MKQTHKLNVTEITQSLSYDPLTTECLFGYLLDFFRYADDEVCQSYKLY